MEIKTLTVSSFMTNCYIISKDNDALIVDPGSGFRKIVSYIEENNLNVLAILLTHGHLDHIGAVDSLVKNYHCDVYACQDDEEILRDAKKNFGTSINSPVTFLDGDKLNVKDFEIEIYYTPGHTAGSVCYKIENYLFTGDTLFKNDIGRTDLYSGSFPQLINSLQIFYHFPLDTIVLPGHEETSTIGEELKNNYQLK